MALEALAPRTEDPFRNLGYKVKDVCGNLHDVVFGFGWLPDDGGASLVEASSQATATRYRRKRQRAGSARDEEEIEKQRMIHIAIERNRRKLMNDHLSVIKSMLPPPYVQRGDQGSIIGGAINFVKELEQHLQSLEYSRKRVLQKSPTPPHPDNQYNSLFSDFFCFPQYSTSSVTQHYPPAAAEPTSQQPRPSASADVEVTMVEGHANIKILTRRHPKQLVRMVTEMFSLGLCILHLNLTTVDHLALYCFSVKVEDESELNSMNEIAAAVHEIVGRIQADAVP